MRTSTIIIVGVTVSFCNLSVALRVSVSPYSWIRPNSFLRLPIPSQNSFHQTHNHWSTGVQVSCQMISRKRPTVFIPIRHLLLPKIVPLVLYRLIMLHSRLIYQRGNLHLFRTIMHGVVMRIITTILLEGGHLSRLSYHRVICS